jgi:GR25 family glycosyltransferase involved in LPS biosynthesis
MPTNMPKCIINLPKDYERLERMKKRLKYHNLQNNTSVIYAADYLKPSKEFSTFIRGFSIDTPYQFSCASNLLAHIQAVRKIVDSSDIRGGIILEDDVMFHNYFTQLFCRKMQILPKYCRLLLLSPYISKQVPDSYYLGEGIYDISPYTWSAACYWISKDYAKECLFLFDRPLIEYPNSIEHRSSVETIIIQRSFGCFTLFPLAVEDCISTNIQHGYLEGKRKYWSFFGYENYNLADKMCS